MNTALLNKTKYCILIAFIFPFLCQSCIQKTPEQKAIEWTENMKRKILKNAGQKYDSTVIDSVHGVITLRKGGKILKDIYLTKQLNSFEKATGAYDTALIVYYGSDANFQFVEKPCIPGQVERYEVVAYKNDRYGLAIYKNCKNKERQTGFQFKNLNVGTWTTYDSSGAITTQVNVGNSDKLKQLDSFILSN